MLIVTVIEVLTVTVLLTLGSTGLLDTDLEIDNVIVGVILLLTVIETVIVGEILLLTVIVGVSEGVRLGLACIVKRTVTEGLSEEVIDPVIVIEGLTLILTVIEGVVLEETVIDGLILGVTDLVGLTLPPQGHVLHTVSPITE